MIFSRGEKLIYPAGNNGYLVGLQFVQRAPSRLVYAHTYRIYQSVSCSAWYTGPTELKTSTDLMQHNFEDLYLKNFKVCWKVEYTVFFIAHLAV